MARRVLDSDGVEVTAGCRIQFSYGIPFVRVEANVIERDGKLIALTPGHNPEEVQASTLKQHVHEFWVMKND